MDDVPYRKETLHAAFLRSSYAHARIISIDISKALKLNGVEGILTGQDVKKWSEPFIVGVKQPMEHWSLAIDKVRYVGEPIAIIIASDRYLAEDALELITVEYEELKPVMDISSAIKKDAPILHDKVKSNIERSNLLKLYT